MKYYFLLFYLSCNLPAMAQTPSAAKHTLSADEFFAKQREAIGKPFPEFSAMLGDSGITKQSFRGKTVFLNFWFEACAPCVAEFEGLNELYRKTKDSRDFVFLSFTFETPEKIKEIKKRYGLQYGIASVPGEECHRLNQNNGFPTNIILDKNGTISYLFSGGNTDKKKASDFLMTEFYPKILYQLEKQ